MSDITDYRMICTATCVTPEQFENLAKGCGFDVSSVNKVTTDNGDIVEATIEMNGLYDGERMHAQLQEGVRKICPQATLQSTVYVDRVVSDVFATYATYEGGQE